MNYEQICKCCRKCGKTFYKKGNNQKVLCKWGNMILRLHYKKCVGILDLNDFQIAEICNAEADAYNAPMKNLSKQTASHSYNLNNQLNVDIEEYIKLLKKQSK